MKASQTNHCLFVLALLVSAVCASNIRATAAEPDHPQPPKLTKEHKLFKFDVGMWDATMKIWPAPGAEPIESKATEKNMLLPGGFWLLSRFEGKIGEMKFSGAGTFGYDPTEKKFVGTWIDSMNPHMLVMKGDYDEATKTMTMVGQNREPDGKMHTSKEIARRVDDDTRTFEMQMQGDDGKYFKMMEINYKRRPKQTSK
jgi:hypothetical protein